jgi:hypothetical protein
MQKVRIKSNNNADIANVVHVQKKTKKKQIVTKNLVAGLNLSEESI